MTPQGRVFNALSKGGWTVEPVERWIGGGKFSVRKDMFGFGDLLGISPNCQYAVIFQVTSVANIQSRVKKIITECLRKAIIWMRVSKTHRIQVIGVRKKKPEGKVRFEYTYDIIEIELKEEINENGNVFRELVASKPRKDVPLRSLSIVSWTGENRNIE